MFHRLSSLWRRDTWIRPFLRESKRQVLVSLALGAGAVAFACALMFTSGYLISLAAERPELGVWALFVPLAFVQIFGLGKPALGYFERLSSHDWVLRMTSALRLRLYTALESSPTWTRQSRIGRALGLLAEDIGHVQNLYLRCVFPSVVAYAAWVAFCLALGVFDALFALFMFVALATLTVVAPFVSVAANRKRLSANQQLQNDLYTQSFDNVMGLTDWIYAGRRADFKNRVMETCELKRRNRARIEAFGRRRDLLTQLLFGLLACALALWAGTHFGMLTHTPAQTGDTARAADLIAAFVLGFFPLLEAFAPLSDAACEGAVHAKALARLNELSNAEANTPSAAFAAPVEPAPSRPAALTASPAAAESATVASARSSSSAASTSPATPAQLDIRLHNVGFAYDDSEPVLANVSLFIPARQHVAVLGKSGVGKSTLASLIHGDLKPQSGTVELAFSPPHESSPRNSESPSREHTDNSPTRNEQELGREALFPAAEGKKRSDDFASVAPAALDNESASIAPAALGDSIANAVSVVQQNPYLFNRTLFDNLRMDDPSITRSQAAEALEQVELGTLLKSLPNGLDTMVDEAGLRFSGGERQRIALARALLRNTPIVILDEPTVSLDPITERALMQTVYRVFAGKTLIIITHHLANLQCMDRIVFLENANIALDGSPAELERTSSRYRTLLAFDEAAFNRKATCERSE